MRILMNFSQFFFTIKKYSMNLYQHLNQNFSLGNLFLDQKKIYFFLKIEFNYPKRCCYWFRLRTSLAKVFPDRKAARAEMLRRQEGWVGNSLLPWIAPLWMMHLDIILHKKDNQTKLFDYSHELANPSLDITWQNHSPHKSPETPSKLTGLEGDGLTFPRCSSCKSTLPSLLMF